MKSTRGPLALAVAGALVAVVSAVLALSASAASTRTSGLHGVAGPSGWAPGAAPSLVFLLGLALVGVGAAVHDGRRLGRGVARPTRRGDHPGGHVRVAPPEGLPGRVVGARAAARARRTATGTQLHLVAPPRR